MGVKAFLYKPGIFGGWIFGFLSLFSLRLLKLLWDQSVSSVSFVLLFFILSWGWEILDPLYPCERRCVDGMEFGGADS